MLIPFNLDFLFAYIMDDGVVRELEVVSGMFAILMSPVRDSVGHSGELGGVILSYCYSHNINDHVFHHGAVSG